MEMLLYLVPVFGILGLLFAAYLAARVGRQDAGNDRMKEIAAAISDGAQAFLTADALTSISQTTLQNLSNLEKGETCPNDLV